MDNQVFFSVIVPVYKVEPYLQKCVDSVLGQTFRDFELILVDDGSPDGCPQLCDAYAQKDDRVVVIHKENGGLSSARNAGMKMARGKYISFLDSDDFWIRRTVLEDLYETILTEQADVVVIKAKRYYQDTDTFSDSVNPFSGKDFSAHYYDAKLKDLICAQVYRANAWNKVFSSHLMKEQDLYFTENIISEDIDWAARLCIAAKRISVLEEVAHGYRYKRPGSITSSLKLKNLIDTKESIERCIHYLDGLSVTEEFKFAYFSYVAYRYVIWMAESAKLKDPSKKPLVREMKHYTWLLDYDGMKRVKMVKKTNKILGYRMTCALLGFYLKHRTV